jgi:hypothetical protein
MLRRLSANNTKATPATLPGLHGVGYNLEFLCWQKGEP